MFQIIVTWNLTRPDQELRDIVDSIKLRGYNSDTFLTGEFAWKLAEREIRALSVSDISDRYCPTRRDLYFRKGIKRLSGRKMGGKPTWGSKAGILVEDYIINVLKTLKRGNGHSYSKIIEFSDKNHTDFINENTKHIKRLKKLEETQPKEKGNTEWLEKLLKSCGRAELASSYLNEMLKEDVSITRNDILMGDNAKINAKQGEKLQKTKQIGINLLESPPAPDFIIPTYRIIGDIKTGTEFKDHFQLTCAGYALAYENVKGREHDINWGVIYFFPTRNPSWFRKPITFAQIYIFPIDDYLRKEFLTKRDEAYNIISKEPQPPFPPDNERQHCHFCKFKDFCIQEGLVLGR